MWLEEVRAKAQRKNQLLFDQDNSLLWDLRERIALQPRRALILWALDLAQETAAQLEDRYPADSRPREAVEAARAWAAGEIKMPIAKRAILACHAMAKELSSPADIARCHAVGQACSVVHTEGHALGYPMYELTAIVRETGIGNCREAVERRNRDYIQRLQYWREREASQFRQWAAFLKKASDFSFESTPEK